MLKIMKTLRADQNNYISVNALIVVVATGLIIFTLIPEIVELAIRMGIWLGDTVSKLRRI